MYRNLYQGGFFTIFCGTGSKPLNIWDVTTKNGYIKKYVHPEIRAMVLELRGCNVSTTYMVCPKGNQILGITMPFLVMVVKNTHKYFCFEVTIKDETGTRRRFRVANFQSSTQVLPLSTAMPLCLGNGWNQIQFNLAEFCQRAYQKQFIEVQKIKINANIIIRCIYFAQNITNENELPRDYKIYMPIPTKGRKVRMEDTETLKDKGSLTQPINKLSTQRKSFPENEYVFSKTKPLPATSVMNKDILNAVSSENFNVGKDEEREVEVGDHMPLPTKGRKVRMEDTETLRDKGILSQLISKQRKSFPENEYVFSKTRPLPATSIMNKDFLNPVSSEDLNDGEEERGIERDHGDERTEGDKISQELASQHEVALKDQELGVIYEVAEEELTAEQTTDAGENNDGYPDEEWVPI